MDIKRIFLNGALFLVPLVVLGAILWFGLGLNRKDNDIPTSTVSENSPAPSDNTGNSPSLDDEPPADKLPLPPADYKVLKEIKPVRSDLEKPLREGFSERLIAIEKNPESPMLWAELGSIKHSFADYDGAKALYLYALRINPSTTLANANLVDIYRNIQPDFPKAEYYLKQIIKTDKNTAVRAYVDLSDLYRYQYKEKADLADDVLLEAYKAYPNDHGFLNALAWYYKETGDTQKAIEYFEKFLEKEPNNESAKEELEWLRAKKSS